MFSAACFGVLYVTQEYDTKEGGGIGLRSGVGIEQSTAVGGVEDGGGVVLRSNVNRGSVNRGVSARDFSEVNGGGSYVGGQVGTANSVAEGGMVEVSGGQEVSRVAGESSSMRQSQVMFAQADLHSGGSDMMEGDDVMSRFFPGDNTHPGDTVPIGAEWLLLLFFIPYAVLKIRI